MKRMLLSLFFMSAFGQLQMFKVHHLKIDAAGTGSSCVGTSNDLQQTINDSNAVDSTQVTGKANLFKIIIGDVSSESEKVFVLKKELKTFSRFVDNRLPQVDRIYGVMAVRLNLLREDLDGGQIRAG
ncbi:MAG TPA: hypothetical protein VL053_17305 [Arachidicoccus sp.]|nr:hypothetical protein [Arachidicoccus sp.]